jgi:hypothetical protein
MQGMSEAPPGAAGPPVGDGAAEAVPAVRAQLLATEHWGLLAARSTAQSEVLTRIGMLLTLVSAGLVSLALVGQATRFRGDFPAFAVTVLALVTVVGVLTQIRVQNVALEDLMYVLAMNRMRAAYVDLDPGVARYFLASQHDDQAGVARTYYFLGRRSAFSQVAGSSMIFTMVVDGGLVGLLAASIASASGGGMPIAVTTGGIVGFLYLALSVVMGGRSYFRIMRTYRPLNPTAPERPD